jgi:hypothetical protein
LENTYNIRSCILHAPKPLDLRTHLTYFSPCSVSFVLIGEYIQFSPLINFSLIIPSNIHLQCLCSTKNEKKQHHEGNKNYFYSDSLTRPRHVKNKYVILRHLGDMCLFTSALRASLPQNNLSPRCLKITYIYIFRIFAGSSALSAWSVPPLEVLPRLLFQS